MLVSTSLRRTDIREWSLLSFLTGLTPWLRLKPLDIETMKRLGSRVNLIPVIAKADTMTPQDIIAFKENVGRLAFLIDHMLISDNRRFAK
jgi:septin family protein